MGLRFQIPESLQILVGNFNIDLAGGEIAFETRKRNSGRIEKHILVEQVFNLLSDLKHTQPGETVREVIHGSRWEMWDEGEGSLGCLQVLLQPTHSQLPSESC